MTTGFGVFRVCLGAHKPTTIPAAARTSRWAMVLAEQIDFYEQERVKTFERWLAGLLDSKNDEPGARSYGAGTKPKNVPSSP